MAVIWTERLHELGASQHLCPDVDSTLGLQHGSFRVPVLLSWQLRISKIHVLGRSLYLPINLTAAVIASLLLLSNINTALRLPRFKGGDYRSVGGVTEKLQKPSYITLLLPSVGSCKELVLDLTTLWPNILSWLFLPIVVHPSTVFFVMVTLGSMI